MQHKWNDDDDDDVGENDFTDDDKAENSGLGALVLKAESQHRRSSATTSAHASACFPNSFMKCNGYTETCTYLMCTILVCTHAIAP